MVLLSLVLLGVGMSQVLWGLYFCRIRPHGHPGWCRRCRYPASDGAVVCPECGAALTRAGSVRAYLRVRRYRWIIPGLLLLLLGGGGLSLPVIATLRGVDTVALKPVWLLLLESNTHGTDAEPARGEILRRYRKSLLTPAQTRTCIDSAVQRFTTIPHTWFETDADLVVESWLASDLSNEDMKRILETIWPEYTAVTARSIIRQRAPLPYTRLVAFPGPSDYSVGPLQIMLYRASVLGSAGSTITDSRGIGIGAGSIHLSGRSLGGEDTVALPLDVGEHQVTLAFDYTITSRARGTIAWRNAVPIHVTIVPADTQLTRGVPDESMRETITQAVIREFEREWVEIEPTSFYSCGKHSGYVGIRRTPVNVAFDVYLRYGGGQHKTVSFALPHDSPQRFTGHFLHDELLKDRLPPETTSIDVILRSNPLVADSLVEILPTIWSGEIVFENVPVSIEPLDRKR